MNTSPPFSNFPPQVVVALIHSVIFFFFFLLSTYYVPGTGLGVGNTDVNRLIAQGPGSVINKYSGNYIQRQVLISEDVPDSVRRDEESKQK